MFLHVVSQNYNKYDTVHECLHHIMHNTVSPYRIIMLYASMYDMHIYSVALQNVCICIYNITLRCTSREGLQQLEETAKNNQPSINYGNLYNLYIPEMVKSQKVGASGSHEYQDGEHQTLKAPGPSFLEQSSFSIEQSWLQILTLQYGKLMSLDSLINH